MGENVEEKLAQALKRFSIFQLTRFHKNNNNNPISMFTKCPRGPIKWTIATTLSESIAFPDNVSKIRLSVCLFNFIFKR